MLFSFCVCYIPGQPKICYPWGKFPGIKPKNLPAAFGGRKFFSPALSPQGTNSKIFFTHGIPICYSQGSFQKKNSPPLTPQGSFSEKFEIFGPFLAKLGGEQQGDNPKIFRRLRRPRVVLKKIFSARQHPWGVDPYLTFFTHGTKCSMGSSPTPFVLLRESTKKIFLGGGRPNPSPPPAQV